MLGVYIHIPFCESKCNYCAFSSFVKSKEEQRHYITKLIEEINSYNGESEIDTIYIGGGTPSILDEDLFVMLANAIKKKFNLLENYEWTIEANPCSLSEEKLVCYKNNGVNRISLGVRSLLDEQLQFAGRKHNREMAINAIQLAKKYIDNVSCDLLIGLKGMNRENFLSQIQTLANLEISHISAYMLQVENGTPLFKMVERDKYLLPDEDESVDVYNEMVLVLKNLGYDRYEVSNFAKKEKESRHNFKYWTGDDYIGFGLGAHSYLQGRRFANSSNFEDYYSGKLAIEEVLTENQLLEEHIMLGLRCKNGISKEFLLKKDYDIKKNENYLLFLSQGILIDKGDKIYLNPDFYGVNNYIIVQLLP